MGTEITVLSLWFSVNLKPFYLKRVFKNNLICNSSIKQYQTKYYCPFKHGSGTLSQFTVIGDAMPINAKREHCTCSSPP